MKPKDWDKLSKDYFSEIESPFENGVNNPLMTFLDTIGKEKYALDLGCGIGNLIPHIHDKFQKIIAIDFSKGMITQAKKKNHYKNVEYKVMNYQKLNFRFKFDHVFAINSLIGPSIIQVQTAMNKSYDLLKRGGLFVGIFPSLESDILRASITFDKFYEEYHSESEAIKDIHTVLSSENYDFLTGHYENNGKQKHFYKIQLEYRLKKAGFSSLKFKKVEYPWSICVDKEFQDCKEEMKLFDWYVVAKKA